jgi:hypothetical protein
MIRIIILAAFLFCATVTSAQKVRFRDLAPALDSVSQSQQMALLWEYLLEDPNHANASFRYAMLHYDFFRKADPLLEFRKAMAHAREGNLRLIRAKILVTASEVKGDNEYYAPLFKTVDSKGKPYVEFPVVLQKITYALDSTQKFQEKMPAIYSAFTKSVRLYDQAVKTFASINTEYKTLEDIYMFYGPALDKQLEILKQSYDSSIHYFQQYKTLTNEYPLGKYNQKINVKNISVYRMDGLITRLNFLSNNIDLWNYSAWVDGVRKMYKDEIVGIKEKIEKTESVLSQSLTSLQQGNKPPETLPGVAKDLVFQLNNYDKNSLALSLLEYKAFKQNWLKKLNTSATDSTVDGKLQLYSQLIQMNRAADTLSVHLKTVMQPHSVQKHAGFLDKYYGGTNGLEKFVKDENEWINNTFNQYQDILKTNLLAYTPVIEKANTFLKFGTFNVPLFADKKSIDQLDNLTLLTTKVARNPDGSMYVTGVHKMNKKTGNNLTGYIARVNPDGKPAWFKELNFTPDSLGTPDAANYVGDMVATQEGCAVIVSSVRPSTQVSSNNFVFVNEKGEMKNFKMKDVARARKLIYQEASNSFIMLFKGSAEKQDYQTQEVIALTSINALGDLLWHQEIPISGTVREVVTVRDGYLITGNFTALKDKTGKEVRTKVAQGQSNPYLIKLDLRGNLVNIVPVLSDKSIYIDKVVKVNDGSINLIGYESTFSGMEDPNTSRGNVMHMMTTFDLKPVCSNFQ